MLFIMTIEIFVLILRWSVFNKITYKEISIVSPPTYYVHVMLRSINRVCQNDNSYIMFVLLCREKTDRVPIISKYSERIKNDSQY